MRAQDYLDPIYFGFAYELGSAKKQDVFEAMLDYSPLIQATPKKYPTILTIVGSSDDRVNPAHSYKFVEKLVRNQQGTSPIMLYSVKNAGHHPMSQVNPMIRREFQARMWTAIYKVLGVQ